MADKNTVEISFKAVDADKLEKAIKGLDNATKSLVKGQAKLVAEGKKVKETNEKLSKSKKKLGQRTRILGGTFAVLRSKMLLFNFAMGLGIRQLGRFGGASAKVDSMSRAFNTLSGGTEILSGGLNKLKHATNGTMSEFDLFQQANNAMILGVTKNSDEMAEMFDIAQRLGRALGRDTASSVESLITGIGRQSRLMLDNIGIIVKSDEAYEKYAKQLDTTVDKLTDAQKKQAFLEATMESARAKVKTLGAEVLTIQDSYDRLSTATSNLATATGNALQPKIGFLAKTFTSLAKSVTIYLNTYADSRKIITKNTALLEEEVIIMAKLKTARTALAKMSIHNNNEVALTEEILKLDKDLNDVRTRQFDKQFKAIKLKEEETAIQKALAEVEKKRIAVNDAFRKKAEEQAVVNAKLEASQKAQTKAIAGEAKALEELAQQEEKLQELRNSQKEVVATISGDPFALEILQLESWAEESKQLFNESGEERIAIEQFVAEEIKRIRDQESEETVERLQKEKDERIQNGLDMANLIKNQAQNLLGFHEDNVNQRKDNAIKALKDSDEYERASSEKRKTMEKEVNKTFAEEEKRLFHMKQMSSLADIAMNTATSMSKHLANPVMMGIITALGALQAGVVMSQQPPVYEQGGLVGGNRHSQGGTMIEAERGEFVMSRNAVESIGAETLNQMNQSGNTGVTVNISAPLVDDTVVDRIIPAIQLALNEDRASLKI